MATDNKPIPLTSAQYANLTITLDGTLGLFNPGGLADEGYYSAIVKDIGLSVREGKDPSLAVTLGGIGNGDVYTYIPLPSNPNAEHFQTYQRLFNNFLASTGYDVSALPAGTAINPAWIANFVNSPSVVYYYPPIEGPDGKLLNSTQEVFFQTADQRSAVETQTAKPPVRRNKPAQTIDHNQLGAIAAAAATQGRAVMPPAPHAPPAPTSAAAPSAPIAPPPPAARPMAPPPPPPR